MTSQEQYIEEVGLFYETYGLPRMAGRILGYLLSSTSDHVSFVDITEALRASKGSISANINLLLSQGMIEKHTVTGDRKSYYRLQFNAFSDILEDKRKAIVQFKGLFEKANTFHEGAANATTDQLREIISYYTFLEKEIVKIRERWLNQKQ